MDKELHVLDNDVSNELKEIYKAYKIRTKNIMLNFSLGRTINELISNLLIKFSEEEIINLLKVNNVKLTASNDNPEEWTTTFDCIELIKSIKQDEYITRISKSALIELVAALDQTMVELAQYFLPNIPLDKGGFKKKKLIVNYYGKYIQIDSKTLIYPYIIYRHCYKFNDENKKPILFNDRRALLWIRDSIALRHFIIHNDGKFLGKEKDLFITRYVNTTDNCPLEFDKNIIDTIYWFHIDHLLDFINTMFQYGQINATSEWNPCPLNDIDNNICFKDELNMS